MSLLKTWWDQPDQFDWMTTFLRRQGLIRAAQVTMVIVAGSAAMAPLSVIASQRKPTAWALVVGVVVASFTAAMAVFWLTRWPTRWQSAVSAVAGVLCIPCWSFAQPTAMSGILGCTALAVTGGYIAFFHNTKLLLVNTAVAAVVIAAAALRLARETNVTAAMTAFWLVWFLNASVALGARGMSLALKTYVVRAEEDPLTGLLNRRGFVDALTHHLATPLPAGAHLTVMMVDLDNFKRINDTHGHAVGDQTLLAVAGLLQEHFSPTAAICRAGGEEFLIALTSTTLDTGPLAARLCSGIARLTHQITASIGTASAEIHRVTGRGGAADLIEQLIRLADNAMYVAKRNGGNQAQHA